VNPPRPLLETEETERIRDLVTRIGHLTPWQLAEFARIMAGRDPDLVESSLRVIPRACRRCGQIIPWPADSGRPL
jgi:hypothetical protein